MVTAEQLTSLKSGAMSVASVATGAAEKLTAEAINLFVIQSGLHVLKFASVFIIFYMIKRYLEYLQTAGFGEKAVRALKLSFLIISVTFFTTQSFPHLLDLTEALVAPNIFLLKKGAEFYKEVK